MDKKDDLEVAVYGVLCVLWLARAYIEKDIYLSITDVVIAIFFGIIFVVRYFV